MTEPLEHGKQKSRKHLLTPGQLCFGWFSLFCLLLILRNTEIAMEYMSQGLRLCAKTVIPALFPFMVISELIVSGGIGAWLIRPIAPICKKIFRLPEAGCCAVLLGMLCGFPVGIRCAISALDAGRLTREDVQRVLLFSTNPSTAFLINAVGVSLWGNKRFGLRLCAVVMISQLTVGLLFTHVFCRKKAILSADCTHGTPSLNTNAVKLFTQAVSSSCFGILLVCAYVIFFSALAGTLHLTLDQLHASSGLKTVVFCLLELSGGVNAASGLSIPSVAALLCAFAAGWSGFSVHCQLLAICDGHGLKFHSYFLAKLLQGTVCVLLFWLFIRMDPSILVPANPC